MKFEVTNIQNNLSQDLIQKIKIDFIYYGDDKEIVIKISEVFFDLGYRMVGGVIKVSNGFNYWVSDTVGEGLKYRFCDKIKIEFLDEKSGDILHSKIYPINNNNPSLRSHMGNISNKNVWVIGDSNVYNYFNKYKKNCSDISINGQIIIPIDIPELSINRFVNRDYLYFLKSLPIISGDDIILMLGEIDCRVGFYRNSDFKENNLIDQINNVTDRYINTLNKIKKEINNVNLLVSLPNPVLRDGWLKDKKDLTYKTNQLDRIFTRTYFEKYFTKKLNEINVECLNLTKGFENEIGFIKDDILYENDTHNKPTDIVFNNLKKHYNFTK